VEASGVSGEGSITVVGEPVTVVGEPVTVVGFLPSWARCDVATEKAARMDKEKEGASEYELDR